MDPALPKILIDSGINLYPTSIKTIDGKIEIKNRALKKLIERHSGIYLDIVNSYMKHCPYPSLREDIINDKAIWNPAPIAGSQNFELHESEEKNLVIKILQYAGVSLKDPAITQLAAQKEGAYVQQEKA